MKHLSIYTIWYILVIIFFILAYVEKLMTNNSMQGKKIPLSA